MTSSGRRLRVLFVIDHAGSPGGAERYVAGLAQYMPRDRIASFVCSTRVGDPSAMARLSELGVPHLDVGRRSRVEVHRMSRLVALIRSQRFDVIHAHKFGSNAWCSVIGRLCRVPVILAHEHNWAYDGGRLRMLVDGQIVGRLADRFLTVSEGNRRRMIELEKVIPEKVLVMPTAYIPHEGPGSSDLRAELGVAPSAPLVGVAAGLRPEKALEVMIEAWPRVLSQVPGAHLAIAGDGPCRAALESQIAALGVSDCVHLLGLRRDVDTLMRCVDVGAMSSDWEGMPLFVFECMATDTPLVATAVGGLTEIVDDGSTGLLVPPRDPVALGSALGRLLTDRKLAAHLAHQAARRLEDFHIETVAARFADLYFDLFAARAR